MLASLRKLIRRTDKRIVFVGIGNVLHRDDGVGVYISRQITERNNIRVIHAEVSIENYIGKINSLHPDFIVLIDNVFFNKKPGYCRLIPAGNLLDFTTNTHNISLGKISELFSARVLMLGIQPLIISFGEEMSPEVKRKADEIIKAINGGD